MTAKDYLLQIGFDEAHLPELFNDDDKSYYKIVELMDAYHESKVKKLPIQNVSVSACPKCDCNKMTGDGSKSWCV